MGKVRGAAGFLHRRTHLSHLFGMGQIVESKPCVNPCRGAGRVERKTSALSGEHPCGALETGTAHCLPGPAKAEAGNAKAGRDGLICTSFIEVQEQQACLKRRRAKPVLPAFPVSMSTAALGGQCHRSARDRPAARGHACKFRRAEPIWSPRCGPCVARVCPRCGGGGNGRL